MKKNIFVIAAIGLTYITDAQVTSPTFDPVWAAKFQQALNDALPATGFHGVSVALTFPGMGTFIGVAGESAPRIPMTPDMQFGIGGNTKLFTAVLALKLQELGILSLDDPLSAWLSAYTNINGATTIRQCLLHETGFFDYAYDIDPTDAALVSEPQHFYTQQQVLQRVGPPHFEPGKAFNYSNTDYNLAALAMEAASGKTFTQLLHQYIFDPLDLDSTFLAAYESPNGNVAHGWYFNNDIGTTPLLSPYSMYWSAGAIYSTANEMVQWYDNLFAGNIINQASLEELRHFDNATWWGLGVLYNYFLEDDEVDGTFETVPGYICSMGYDVKRHSSLCILTNQGEGASELIIQILAPLLTQFYFGYTRKPNDAGITKILSPASQKCENSFSPEVLLQNFGSSNLQSVTIKYQVDDGTINSYNWTGNLLNDATTSVTLPSINVSPGYHSFKAFTFNPNGNAEGYDYNNEASSKFTIINAPLATSIDEGFEGAAFPTGWQNGNNTVFDWGQTSVGSFANGSNKGIVKNNWDDRTGRFYDLELPELNLSSDNNPVLSFDYSYAFDINCPTCLDELAVLVSKDCGKTYHPVFNKRGQALKTTTDIMYHYPKSDEWGTRTVNLSAFKTNVLIKIRATSGQGNLLFLDNIKVADVSAICQTPTDLNELQITNSSVKLSWKFQGNADHFDVYYRPRQITDWNHNTVAGNKQWINISGLLSSTDYEWYITATCSSGNSLASAKSYFITEALLSETNPSSQKELLAVSNQKKQLIIFPNPVKDNAIISFSISKPGKVSFAVYDMTGRLVKKFADKEYNEGTHQLGLNAKDIAPGIYLLRMETAGYSESRKFIVMK